MPLETTRYHLQPIDSGYRKLALTYRITNNQQRPLKTSRDLLKTTGDKKILLKNRREYELNQRLHETSRDQQIQLETTGEHWRPVQTNRNQYKLVKTSRDN